MTAEFLYERLQAVEEQIVPQQDYKFLTGSDEAAGEVQGICNAARLFLNPVSEVNAILLTAAKKISI
ncbi:hypothetical protein D3C85_1761130 [compost metagenome]